MAKRFGIALGGISGAYIAFNGAYRELVGKDQGEAVSLCAENRDFKPYRPSPAKAVLLAEYRKWLQRHGVDTKYVDISLEQGDARFGGLVASLSASGRKFFSSGFLGMSRMKNAFKKDPVIIQFPLENAISYESVSRNEVQGSLMKHLGNDEKGYPVIIHLMIEKMKGGDSYLKSWISLLPKEFSLPLAWTVDELEWLRGTSLYTATMIQRAEMERAWKDVKEICRQIAQVEELHASPTFNDFVWATAAYKSLAMPLPNSTNNGYSFQIIPGSEIFKQSSDGVCRWKVERDGDAQSGHASLCAVCSRKKNILKRNILSVCPEDDVSSEEMIFQYGAMDNDPKDEVLMINCPLPPTHEWDDTLKKRFALLMNKDLRPQLFLSRSHLKTLQKNVRATTGKFKGRKAVEREDKFRNMVPADVLDTIKIFVMDAEQLDECILDHISEDGAPRRVRSNGNDQSPAAASGMRMAILTTIVRLLEVKLDQLESLQNGTGSLESDAKILEAITKEQENTTAMPHSGPTRHQMAALHHRMEQKKLAREYLIEFNAYLQDEMKYLYSLKEDESL